MVCFVILHYIAQQETVDCIQSIINNVKGEKHIIVVDNASPNNSGEFLKKLYNENSLVTILESKSNVGFAKGNNLGYKYAVENYNPDFIVVMNNDMIIEQETFIEEIINSYNKYNYAIMGPDIYSTKKHYHQNPQTRKVLSLKDLKRKHNIICLKYHLRLFLYLKWKIYDFIPKKKYKQENEKIENSYIDDVVINPLLHGSCYIFSNKFISLNKEECFFNKTFMYMEAEILHYKSIRDNLKMIYYPNIKILHHEDVSTNQEYSKQYKKSVFTLKCLKDSCREFIKLMENDNKENGKSNG